MSIHDFFGPAIDYETKIRDMNLECWFMSMNRVGARLVFMDYKDTPDETSETVCIKTSSYRNGEFWGYDFATVRWDDTFGDLCRKLIEEKVIYDDGMIYRVLDEAMEHHMDEFIRFTMNVRKEQRCPKCGAPLKIHSMYREPRPEFPRNGTNFDTYHSYCLFCDTDWEIRTEVMTRIAEVIGY